jgi:hypothetical protein
MSEDALKFTIEVEGWEQMRVIAPIAYYVHTLAHCRDEDGEVDDIGVVCALDDAVSAIAMILAKMHFGLLQMPKNEVILDNETWAYLPEQLLLLIASMEEIGPTRIRGEDGTLEDKKP